MAELKNQSDAAGGSIFYGTISSTLDCPFDGYPEGVDGAIINIPLCVSKGCDSSMLGEEYVSCGANTALTDEPQDGLNGCSAMYGTSNLALASFLAALIFFFM